jgi:hypothetical protein
MTGTLTPTCPLCGLRYENRPLLELHIREDHRQNRHDEPGGPSRSHDLASRSSGTTKEVTAPTAARSARPGQAMTAPRRAIRALRYVNDELMRASEAIIRSARAPRPRPQASVPADAEAHPGSAAERANRAA